MSTNLLLDIGASKTRIGVSKNPDQIDKKEIFETPRNFDDATNLISRMSFDLLEGKKIDKCIIGIAGPANGNYEKLMDSNLADWIGKPLRKSLEKKLGININFYNDCVLCGLGEANFGSAKNDKIVAYVTISSGVNGVKIVNHKVDANAYGFEIGKQIIDIKERKNLEWYVGGSFIEKRFDKKPEKIDDIKIWEDVERALSVGLANTILYWSPQILVLGGGVTNKIDLENVKRNINDIVGNFFQIPKIAKSELGDFAGLWGGLTL